MDGYRLQYHLQLGKQTVTIRYYYKPYCGSKFYQGRLNTFDINAIFIWCRVNATITRKRDILFVIRLEEPYFMMLAELLMTLTVSFV